MIVFRYGLWQICVEPVHAVDVVDSD